MKSKMDTEDEVVDAAVEDKYETSGEAQLNNTLDELRQILSGLNEFDKNCQQQLVMAARGDNNLLVAETKGMIRVVTMLGAQLNARIEELSKRTMN